MKNIKNITVIGTGNVALQLSKLFLKNKFKIDGIYGRSNFSDSQIDNHLYTDKVSNISKNSDLYLVAVSDDSYLELLKNIHQQLLNRPLLVKFHLYFHLDRP